MEINLLVGVSCGVSKRLFWIEGEELQVGHFFFIDDISFLMQKERELITAHHPLLLVYGFC